MSPSTLDIRSARSAAPGGFVAPPLDALGDGRRPDVLALWPIDHGQYGLDATFRGSWGCDDAERLARRLSNEGTPHSLRQHPQDGWTVRLGPLSSIEVARALGTLAA